MTAWPAHLVDEDGCITSDTAEGLLAIYLDELSIIRRGDLGYAIPVRRKFLRAAVRRLRREIAASSEVVP